MLYINYITGYRLNLRNRGPTSLLILLLSFQYLILTGYSLLLVDFNRFRTLLLCSILELVVQGIVHLYLTLPMHPRATAQPRSRRLTLLKHQQDHLTDLNKCHLLCQLVYTGHWEQSPAITLNRLPLKVCMMLKATNNLSQGCKLQPQQFNLGPAILPSLLHISDLYHRLLNQSYNLHLIRFFFMVRYINYWFEF